MKDIKARIAKLVASANESQAALMKGLSTSWPGGWESWAKQQKELETELDNIDRDAGKGLVVGRALSFGVADGSANYLVLKVRKNDVAVAHIPLGDAYTFQGVYRKGKELCLPRPVAERQCQMAAGLKAIFG